MKPKIIFNLLFQTIIH